MRRDATASKCFVQLVGNWKLAGDMALERPSLPASELVSFQNYAGLRVRPRAGRPCPAFHGMRKSSTSGFDFADCGMLGGFPAWPRKPAWFWSRRAGGSAIGPDSGPGAGGMAVERVAARAAKAKNGGRLDSRCPEADGEEGGGVAAALWARPAGRIGHRGASRPVPASVSAAAPAKVFPKLSLHRRPSSRIVLLRTGA